MLAVGILNLVIDIILVPGMGMEGAALATTLSWFVFMVILLIQVRRRYAFSPLRRSFLKIGVAFILSVIFLLGLKMILVPTLVNVIISGVLFGMLYLALIILFKIPDKDDLMIIHAIKRKVLGGALPKS